MTQCSIKDRLDVLGQCLLLRTREINEFLGVQNLPESSSDETAMLLQGVRLRARSLRRHCFQSSSLQSSCWFNNYSLLGLLDLVHGYNESLTSAHIGNRSNRRGLWFGFLHAETVVDRDILGLGLRNFAGFSSLSGRALERGNGVLDIGFPNRAKARRPYFWAASINNNSVIFKSWKVLLQNTRGETGKSFLRCINGTSWRNRRLRSNGIGDFLVCICGRRKWWKGSEQLLVLNFILLHKLVQLGHCNVVVVVVVA